MFVSNPRGWALSEGDPRQDEAFVAGLRGAGRARRTSTPRSWSTSAPRPRPRWSSSAATLAHGLRRGAADRRARRGLPRRVGGRRRVRRDRAAPGTASRCCRCSTRPPRRADRGCWSSRAPAVVAASPPGSRTSATTSRRSTGTRGSGVCFDTCHAWAAGHDVATPGGMTATLDALVATVGVGPARPGPRQRLQGRLRLAARPARDRRRRHPGRGRLRRAARSTRRPPASRSSSRPRARATPATPPTSPPSPASAPPARRRRSAAKPR